MKRRLVVYALLLAAVWGYLHWQGRAPEPVVVAIVADGGLTVAGEPATVATLPAQLRPRVGERAGVPVVVRVDPRVPVPTLVAVMEAVKAAGVLDARVESRE